MHSYDDSASPAHRPVEPAAETAPQALPATVLRSPSPATVIGLQRAVGNSAVLQLLADDRSGPEEEESSSVLDVVGRGGGAPLDAGVRSAMESGLGADFGDVRVHTDGKAASSAAAVQAQAYTVGNEIVFGAGTYQPGSPEGQRTLAHELTHVVQQRSGPVEGTPAAGGIALSDPGDRFEQAAEANADRFMAGVQRQPEGEDEELGR